MAEGRKKTSRRDGSAPSFRRAPDTSSETLAPLIVGIGASAGGLDAFKMFFAGMPADSGMAFVLVQHLAPDHRSMLAEIVAGQTPMPVRQIEDGDKVVANSVFVIPPDATLTIKNNTLRVVRPAPPRQHRWPIDAFFSSLAEDQGENGICIVLSGTGSDGSLGLRMIKERGGLALAQAGFDHVAMSGMPQSAASTGLVDQIMPVEKMPARLIEYRRHLIEVAARKDGNGTRRDTAEYLATITSLLRAAVGHDFSHYKQNTVVRRIQRRMQVLQIDTVPAFIERLRQEPAQLHLLFRELLIGVTQFFRDPQAFEALRATVLPDLVTSKKGIEPVRVWVAGCATGEEVYSIAILLKEEMERQEHLPKVQIFGTDIDESALAVARAGRYIAKMAGMSPQRIERRFTKDGDGYCVAKDIREMCVFSPHSIVKDPPFSKLDLISCRNVLIYMDAELQERVARMFHYALQREGTLFLGPSEGITHSTQLFTALDKKHRLFRRRESDAPTHLPHPQTSPTTWPRPPAGAAVASADDTLDTSVRSVLAKHSPVYVVINERHEIVRFSGGEVGRYLEPSPGVASLELYGILRRGLRRPVRTAVQAALAEGQAVIDDNVTGQLDGGQRAVTVIVEPITGRREKFCVVAFQDLGQKQTAPARSSGKASDEAVQMLERELAATKMQLQAALEDAETANEESRSTVEEYQSVNEELQSTNEELETAKEEMQSVNEELQTVNNELSSKNDALGRLNNDMQNLLESTQIATMFLDNDLRIKNFTPAMIDVFRLRDTDLGRPIIDIATRLSYDGLLADAARVLRELSTIEREVQIAGGGMTFLMRIRPYRTVERVIDGVVITFVDITDRRHAEEALREHAAMVEQAQDALVGLTLDGTIRSWNPAAERLYGFAAAEAIGERIAFLNIPDRHDDQIALLDQARAGKVAGPVRTVRRRKDGSDIDVSLTVMPIRAQQGCVVSIAVSSRDITERRRAEAQQALLQHELSHRIKNALATVQSIATQTLRSVPTLEVFRQAFLARLIALANTHNLLTDAGWQGAGLRDVIVAELSPYQTTETVRWHAIGPDIKVGPNAALALGMAIHELATNAAKYGALLVPDGRVDVTWEFRAAEKNPQLHLSWVETGGPLVEQPKKKGFGNRLITEGLALELDGKVRLDFDPAGVRCTIDVPLKSVEEHA